MATLTYFHSGRGLSQVDDSDNIQFLQGIGSRCLRARCKNPYKMNSAVLVPEF